MLSAFLSLYAYGALLTDSVPVSTPHVMPWNENVTLEASSIPEKDELNIAPVIDAKSAIIVDMKNGMVLYEKNIYETMPIASLTKLMTAVIIIEENDMNEIAQISKNASQTEGSTTWLAEGEKITVENLLYASLINSGNDAAVALAEHNAGTVKEFVKKMNTRGKELGMVSTHFVNPTGLDENPPAGESATADTPDANNGANDDTARTDTADNESGGNDSDTENSGSENDIDSRNNSGSDNDENGYITADGAAAGGAATSAPAAPRNVSTAYDMTLLSRYAYGKSFVRRAVTKKELEIASANETLTHKLKNTNDLLNSYLPVLGLKTGTTDAAGECLIAVIENKNGNDILTIVLNSPSRYKETKILADWAFRTYTWK